MKSSASDTARAAARQGVDLERLAGEANADRPRILFITSTRIGDAVLSSGVLAHLIQTERDAVFTIAAGPLAAPLFRAIPCVEQVIVMTKKRSGGHWFDLWRQTVGRRWRMVVDMRGSRTSWFLRAKRRSIAGKPRMDLHKVEEAAEVLGLDTPHSPKLWLDGQVRAKAESLLASETPVLALAPAASAPFKEWPPERFAALANRLTAPDGALPGARIAIFGGPGDEPIGASVAGGLPAERVVDFTGELDLMDAAACLARARLFVGNDSGLMHLAAAAGTPTLGLFGPTDERVYGPWGPLTRAVRAGGSIDAAARERLKRADESLMGELLLDTVLAAAEELCEASTPRHG